MKRGRDLGGNNLAFSYLHTQGERANPTPSSSAQATVDIDPLFHGIDYTCSWSRGLAVVWSENMGSAAIGLRPIQQAI